MTKEEILNLVERAIEQLNENSELTLKQLYQLNGVNSRKFQFERKLIKGAFDTFNSSKLNYANKKNSCTKIEKITLELQRLIESYGLDFDKEKNIVLLNRRNADIINDIILKDDNYISFAKMIFDSYDVDDIKQNKNKALFIVLREIDRDNTTNVWRYKQNRESFYKIIEYMTNPINNFFAKLEQGDEDLPDKLVEIGGTCTKSLSSKICKYLSNYMFDKDNYFINDKFVRHSLLFYMDYYNVDRRIESGKTINKSSELESKDFKYKDICFLLNKLKEKINLTDNLLKDEIDHILWYCYKSFKT